LAGSIEVDALKVFSAIVNNMSTAYTSHDLRFQAGRIA
jgi:hypothetical protein